MYFLNFLDRNAMVNGKLNSLSKDLKLKGTQYNTCVSILFVGYVLSGLSLNPILILQIPLWTDTLQHDPEQSETFTVHGWYYNLPFSCLLTQY